MSKKRIGVYGELQKEADFMRSKLEASIQRKLMLAAEVRFLRRRYEHLLKMKSTNSFKEQSHVHSPTSLKRAKIVKAQLSIGKEASHQGLRLVPGPTFKKKQAPSRDAFPITDQPRKKKSTQVFDSNHKGIMHTRKVITPILNRNQKERMFDANDVVARNSTTAAFDLNQDTTSEREARLPTRAPIFDLNEISTGEEDFQCNAEANKFLLKGTNEELKLSICRDAGESSSRGGKRKISRQDPVALRV